MSNGYTKVVVSYLSLRSFFCFEEGTEALRITSISGPR